MEEENPWLDTEIVKHKNVKSVRPEYKEVKEKKESTETTEVSEKKDSKLTNAEKFVKKENKPRYKKTNTDAEKLNISKLNEKDRGRETVKLDEIPKEKYSNFLQVLVEEFSPKLPENSVKFCVENFGEDWLGHFQKDVEDLKSDLLTSNFFPSPKEIIFLKYIFLLRQGF